MANQRSPKKKVISITLRKDLLKWIDAEREKIDMDRSTFIRGEIYRVREQQERYRTRKQRGGNSAAGQGAR